MVSSSNFLCQWHLAVDASDRFSVGETVTFYETCDLCFAVGGDHDGAVHSLIDAGFEQERHVIDDDGVRVFSCGLFGESRLLAGDAGMDDAFELPAFHWIAEDDVSEGLSVKRAVLVEDRLSEKCDDLSPSRLAGLNDFTGQFVGIDDDRAVLLEHLGDGALAGGDAACEADQNHGCGA